MAAERLGHVWALVVPFLVIVKDRKGDWEQKKITKILNNLKIVCRSYKNTYNIFMETPEPPFY